MSNLCPLCMQTTDAVECPQDGFTTIPMVVWEAAQAQDPWVGRLLEQKYRLTHRVGAGGMGVVYGGVNTTLGQAVAVKLLLTDRLPSDPGLLDRVRGRFRREALLTSRLDHPHIVRTFDFGTTDDDVFFLVMELIDGLPLDEVISAAGALEAPRTVTILSQIAASLVEAHQRGVIHRDLKPHNVLLLQKPGLTDFVKLLDFGVATMLEDSDVNITPITRPDAVVGSPPFMSPEQATAGEVDHRADLYALGVIGYQLLTGRLPFDGTTPLKVLMLHVREPPPPFTPDERDRIPDPLQACIFRLLEKDPKDRYQSAVALHAALEAMRTDVHSGSGGETRDASAHGDGTGRDVLAGHATVAQPRRSEAPKSEAHKSEAPKSETPKSEAPSAKTGRWIVALALAIAGVIAFIAYSPADDPAPGAPAAGLDVPLTDLSQTKGLVLYTDGAGHFVAYHPQSTYSGPIFAGSRERLYLQRVVGGSRSPEQFSATFWDSRFSAGARRALSMRHGNVSLACGPRTIALHAVEAAETAAVLAKVTFMAPRWRRRAAVFASDEVGRYYYVDRTRMKGPPDFRVFVGPKGQVVHHPTTQVTDMDGKLVIATGAGRFVYRQGEATAKWTTEKQTITLDVHDLWRAAPIIYTELGAYHDPMGTPCDPYAPISMVTSPSR